jgi:hypothetical protein
LRTACDFEVSGPIRATAPGDFSLPTESELLAAAQAGIRACAEQFAKPPVTKLKTKVKAVAEKA